MWLIVDRVLLDVARPALALLVVCRIQLRARVLEALTSSREPIVRMNRVERILYDSADLTRLGANLRFVQLTVRSERALIGSIVRREATRPLANARQLRLVVLRSWSRGVRADAVKPGVSHQRVLLRTDTAIFGRSQHATRLLWHPDVASQLGVDDLRLVVFARRKDRSVFAIVYALVLFAILYSRHLFFGIVIGFSAAVR